jgi:hypothetical protein
VTVKSNVPAGVAAVVAIVNVDVCVVPVEVTVAGLKEVVTPAGGDPPAQAIERFTVSVLLLPLNATAILYVADPAVPDVSVPVCDPTVTDCKCNESVNCVVATSPDVSPVAVSSSLELAASLGTTHPV